MFTFACCFFCFFVFLFLRISVDSWWPQSSNFVALGSTVKATMETHLARQDVQSIANLEDLIVPAGRNLTVGTIFFESCGINSLHSVLAARCTIELTQHMSELQWVLNSAPNPENQGYATQAQCPPSMTLLQYLEFTRIRAGGELQFVNIVRALHEGMDFTESHTFDLLRQALWQVGPSPTLGVHKVTPLFLFICLLSSLLPSILSLFSTFIFQIRSLKLHVITQIVF
jgi:hypothetical protein